jgi:2-methylisocitrate lyase-like PEP mutase family enzyme
VTTAADALRALHVPGDPVLLPNVWDAGSARAVEAAGFPAVATSSGAVAASLGYADGEGTPVTEMLDAVARIAGAVSVPVTADIERGYGMGPVELVERLLATGAVGCNLEDSYPGRHEMVDPHEQADFLAAVRQAAGPALVINARVDCFVRGGTVEDALVRAPLYHAAGADCVFPILATDPTAIAALVEPAGGVLNALFTPRTPSLAELASLGVARISFGSGLYQATSVHYGHLLERVAARANPYGS